MRAYSPLRPVRTHPPASAPVGTPPASAPVGTPPRRPVGTPPRRSSQPGGLRNFRTRFGLAVMAVVIPGMLLLTGEPTTATNPRISVMVAAVPGGQVIASGDGFTPRAHITLSWDGSSVSMPAAMADDQGTFEAAVTVPIDAQPGDHLLTAVEHPNESSRQREATVTVRVLVPPATASPSSTLKSASPTLPPIRPTATPTAVPTPAPTAVPTPAPIAVPHGGHAGGGTDPINCSGYPEPRVFLEVHTWWEGQPLAPGQIAHLHAGTCFPLGQTVSGKVAFDVRIMMHDNPGHLFRYQTGLHTEGPGTVSSEVPLDKRCATTCEYWVKTTIDTTQANDGWHEMRFKPRVKFSNGEVQLTSAGWPVRTENGNPDGGFREDPPWMSIVGRGWYDGRGYQNPVFRAPVSDVLPGRVVSGSWNTSLRLDAGSDGFPPTFSAAYVDPDFHQNDEDSNGGGMLLGSWRGAYRGELAIDTTRLANGPHTLVLRVESERPDGRLVALQYVPFTVANQ